VHGAAQLGAGREALEVASLQARMRQLEQKLANALTERDANLKEISKLQEEIKRQEAHYTKEV
jgi:predicted  nucleic acid-binding Zn-ribbon protein